MRIRAALLTVALTLGLIGASVGTAGAASAAQGAVKWFNAEKGYGFTAL